MLRLLTGRDTRNPHHPVHESPLIRATRRVAARESPHSVVFDGDGRDYLRGGDGYDTACLCDDDGERENMEDVDAEASAALPEPTRLATTGTTNAGSIQSRSLSYTPRLENADCFAMFAYEASTGEATRPIPSHNEEAVQSRS